MIRRPPRSTLFPYTTALPISADRVLPEVLRDLDGQVVRLVGDPLVRDGQGGEDLGKRPGWKLDVYHRPDHLRDFAKFCRFAQCNCHRDLSVTSAPQRRRRSPSAPW